ncbi:hypothetical protein F5Y12DRAFT_751993 [Xylaria sp. FL1777]|nr:hypothetical protein F5Y12DRAFT_751993 [Xylaria sp. FL1777]
MNALSIDKNLQVTTWLQSFETVEDPTVQEPTESAAKRLCQPSYRQEDTFANSYNLPGTPPSSAISDASTGQKRRAGEIHPPVDSPKPRTLIQPNVSLRQPRSPLKGKKRASPTKPKLKNPLEMLEKPIYKKGEANLIDLPEDVKGLFSKLWAIHEKEGVVPYEVKEMVDQAEARPYHFRTAPTTGAKELHSALCNIHAEARSATLNGYHETAWNHLVHTPLLKLVYSSITPIRPILPQAQATGQATGQATEAAEEAQPKVQANVRVVPAMSATIWGEYISTTVSWAKSVSAPTEPSTETGLSSRTSVSQSQAYSASEDAMTEHAFSATDLYSEEYSRSDGKKVDYVLAIDPFDNTALQQVISYFIRNEAVERGMDPHFNQTLYTPLERSPIACSIATKVDFQPIDPLLQLGAWIAAWHKRMCQLQRYVLKEYPLLSDLPSNLPSTLFIEIINHQWRLYFVCDRGTYIDIYGPLEIGTTIYITEAYVIVASLQAIKAWAETTFANGMTQWLMCDKLVQEWLSG